MLITALILAAIVTASGALNVLGSRHAGISDLGYAAQCAVGLAAMIALLVLRKQGLV